MRNFLRVKKTYLLFYLSFFIFFTGCGIQPRIDSKQEVEHISVTTSRTKPSVPALKHLQELASQAATAQEYDKANALLERALRLAPYQAETYLELAKVRAASGDILQALVFAERGLLYCKHPVCSVLNSFIEKVRPRSDAQ